MAYTPTQWQQGDVIDAEELNKIEQGIKAAHETDTTLSKAGKHADAAAVGKAIEGLEQEIEESTDGLNGKMDKPTSDVKNGLLLQSTGDGGTRWTEYGMPTDEQTSAAVEAWLEQHPEATTTVKDGSLTEQKLADPLKIKAIKDYITPEMFGAVGDGVADDTTSLQTAINQAFIEEKSVILTAKYLITSPIQVKGVSSTVVRKGSSIIGNRLAQIIAGATIENIIELAPQSDARAYGIEIRGVTLDGDNKATCGLYSTYGVAECLFENILIKYCTKGMHINANCYLNNFRNVRTYHCSDNGILFTSGNNTSNVFEKCYVDTSANAYTINGQYSAMICCCADVISGEVFHLDSFNGVLVSCGSESKIFTTMFAIGSNSVVNVFGGMFWGNPSLTGYYITVAAGSRLNFYGARLNYLGSASSSTGALYSVRASTHLKFRDCSIEAFDGENYSTATSIVFVNTAVFTKTIAVTLDENNNADLDLNPDVYSVLDIYSTDRSGWILMPYRTSAKTYVKVIANEYAPSITNKSFTIRINYINKRIF